MNHIGRSLIFIGALLVLVGIFFLLGARVSWLGRLPGDIIIQKKNFTFYFPLTTSILISIVLSLVFFLFFKR